MSNVLHETNVHLATTSHMCCCFGRSRFGWTPSWPHGRHRSGVTRVVPERPHPPSAVAPRRVTSPPAAGVHLDWTVLAEVLAGLLLLFRGVWRLVPVAGETNGKHGQIRFGATPAVTLCRASGPDSISLTSHVMHKPHAAGVCTQLQETENIPLLTRRAHSPAVSSTFHRPLSAASIFKENGGHARYWLMPWLEDAVLAICPLINWREMWAKQNKSVHYGEALSSSNPAACPGPCSSEAVICWSSKTMGVKGER